MSNKASAKFYTLAGIASVIFSVISSHDTISIIGVNCILCGAIIFAIEDKGNL